MSSYREESASFHTRRLLDRSGRGDSKVYEESDLLSRKGTVRASHGEILDLRNSYDAPNVRDSMDKITGFKSGMKAGALE